MEANNNTERQKRFETLCDRQEELYKKDFEKVFRVLEADKEIKEALKTQGWNMCANLPKEINKKKIDEALTQTGFSNDEAFCKSFIEYISITLEGKRLMQEFSMQLAKEHKKNKPEKLNEWQFYPIRIIAPQQIQEKIIKPMVEDQAIKGEGLFSNSTNIPLEEEEEDEFLMIEAYNCNASMSGYWQELKDFGVIGIGKTDGFLPYQFKQYLLQLLKEVATYIKNNTDAPSKAKNKVTNTLKALDKLPVWGLFFQILLLQGLCRWLENLDIDEKDPSIKEAQLFYNWLCIALADKEMNFCFVPYGDGDKNLLKPLCNYLYTTEIGKAVQEHMFGKPQQTKKQEASTDILPKELNTDEALRYFAKAKENGLIDDNYKWLKGKQLLACFCHDMSQTLTLGKGDRIAWKPFETLFGMTKGTLRSNYNDIQKTGQNPSDIALVDSIFQ